MLLIQYNQSLDVFRFGFDLKTRDPSDYDEVKDLFKKTHVHWHQGLRGYYCEGPDIHEHLEWFKFYNWGYTLTKEAQDVIEENPWYPSTTKFFRGEAFNWDNLQNYRAFNFQREDIEFAVKRSNLANLNDAGLGKSFEAVAIFTHLFDRGKIDSLLIVPQNGLNFHWKREFLHFSKIFREEDFHLIFNENKDELFKRKNARITLISSHLVAKAFSLHKKEWRSKKSLSRVHWSRLRNLLTSEWGKKIPGLLIDESHEFKSPTAIKYKALKSQIDAFEYKIIQSATPSITALEGMWGQFHLLDPGILPYSENAFKLKIAKEIGDDRSVYNIVEYDADKILQVKNSLAPYLIKRLKKNTPEVQAKQFVRPRYFQVSGQHKDIYDVIWENELLRVREEKGVVTETNVFQKFPYTMMCLDNPAILKDILKDQENTVEKLLKSWKLDWDARIPYLDEYLKTYVQEGQEKVIIFDNHPKTLEMLCARYNKYKPLLIHGGTPQSEREGIFQAFNDKDSGNQILFFSIQAKIAGQNLNKACRRIIFYTTPADATLYRQALDRTYRVVSEEDSLVEVFCLEGTFDRVRTERCFLRSEINDAFFLVDSPDDYLKSLITDIMEIQGKAA